MNKKFTLTLGIAFLLFGSCQKEAPKTKDISISNESAIGNVIKPMTVNPGGSATVNFENGRYVAHLGFADVDFGNIYFPSGSFQDGEAVLSIDNNSVGGPYISVAYDVLIGPSNVSFGHDVELFKSAWSKYSSGIINPVTHEPYTRPTLSSFVKDSYGTVGIYKGILVRSHTVPSTVIIRDPSFVPVTTTPSNADQTLGSVTDPNTGIYWTMYGRNGTITRVVRWDANQQPIYPYSATGTYTGSPTNFHVIGTITPTLGTSFSFNENISPL